MKILGGVGRQLTGARQVSQGLIEIVARRKCFSSPTVLRSIAAIRGVGRWRGCSAFIFGTGEVEHRSAVVGEIQSMLTVGHVDSVRQEEIWPYEHVSIGKINISDAQ